MIHIDMGILMAMDGAAVGEEVMHIGQGMWVAMDRGNMVVAEAMDALECRAAVAAERGMAGTVVAGGRLAREGARMVEVGNAAVVMVVVVTAAVKVVVVRAAVEVAVVRAAVVTAEVVMGAEETEVAEVETAAAVMAEVAKAGVVVEASAGAVMGASAGEVMGALAGAVMEAAAAVAMGAAAAAWAGRTACSGTRRS